VEGVAGMDGMRDDDDGRKVMGSSEGFGEKAKE